jgi:predicted transcriptional regulator
LFEDEIHRSPARRSKLEITCDILNVISKGAEKPTRIMQLANVTWDDLIMYLEALIRNQLVSRQVDGKRVTYSLGPRGSAILEHYLALKHEVEPLKLESLTKESISKALKFNPSVGSEESAVYERLASALKAEGSTVLSQKQEGKSGAVHTLGVVVQKANGSKHGYVVLPEVDETEVMKLFVTQLDTELNIHALYGKDVTPKVAALAQVYSLDLSPVSGMNQVAEGQAPGREPKVDVLRFSGKSILLDVDPGISYEAIVRTFATAFRSPERAVFAFTWEGGPIYSALASLEWVHIFKMTSQTAYPKPSGRGAEVAIPQDDVSVVLDLSAKTLRANSGKKSLAIFDSVSDAIVSLGFEKTYAFLKSLKEIFAHDPGVTALFVMKRNAQDERVTSMVKGLFNHHISYDSSGLRTTRET